MRLYVVTCQNASGQTKDITVKAGTDSTACKRAVDQLNTWRPVKALVVDVEIKP